MLRRLRVGLVAALAMAVVLSGVLHAQALKYRPQFPQVAAAETRGAWTGGNPTIWLVNTLVDSAAGAGTITTAGNCAAITCRRGNFRSAMQASGNKLILFETSGYISTTLDEAGNVDAVTPYHVNYADHVTIAGQSAPNPGVTVRDGGTYFVGTEDIVIQHMRFRPSGVTCNSALAFGPYGVVGDMDDIVLDHVSVSWGQDDNIFIHNVVNDVLLWRSISSEGLAANTAEGPSGTGCIGGISVAGHGMAGTGRQLTMIQSLFAHNAERNPYIASDTDNVLLNNVIYNWGNAWGFYHNSVDSSGGSNGPAWFTTAVGNVFLGGLNGGPVNGFSAFTYSAVFGNTLGNQIYRSDNLVDQGSSPIGITVELNSYNYNPNVGSPPTSAPIPTGFTPLAAAVTEAFVRTQAGARPLNRDAVDSRIMTTVLNRSSGWVNIPSDGNGGGVTYPTLAVNTHDLTSQIPANPFGTHASGRTNIEEWLETLAQALEPDEGGEVDLCVAPCEFAISAGSTDGASVTTAAVDTAGSSMYVAGICSYGGGTSVDPGALSTVSVPEDIWVPLTKHGNTNAVGRLYYALTPAVGSRTFSVASVADSYPAVVVYGFSTRLAANVLDLESGASGTGSVTSLAPGSITPTSNNQVLTTLINSYSYGAAPTVNGGFVLPPEAVQPWVGALRVGCALAYLTQTTATAANPTWAFTSTEGAAALAGWHEVSTLPPVVHPPRFRLPMRRSG